MCSIVWETGLTNRS